METRNYYHAGTQQDRNDEVRWSGKTRRSAAAAEREARKLAKKHGGRPIVEYWAKSHGLRPGDSEVVSGAYYVADVIDLGAGSPRTGTAGRRSPDGRESLDATHSSIACAADALLRAVTGTRHHRP